MSHLDKGDFGISAISLLCTPLVHGGKYMRSASHIHLLWESLRVIYRYWGCPLNASPATFMIYCTISVPLFRIFAAIFSYFTELANLALSSRVVAMQTCHSDLLLWEHNWPAAPAAALWIHTRFVPRPHCPRTDRLQPVSACGRDTKAGPFLPDTGFLGWITGLKTSLWPGQSFQRATLQCETLPIHPFLPLCSLDRAGRRPAPRPDSSPCLLCSPWFLSQFLSPIALACLVPSWHFFSEDLSKHTQPCRLYFIVYLLKQQSVLTLCAFCILQPVVSYNGAPRSVFFKLQITTH